jgi:hypothetical protein
MTTSHRIAVAEVRAFVQAGRALFTLVSLRTGKRFTYKVTKAAAPGLWFVKVLRGFDNTSDYAFLGTIFHTGEYRHGKRSGVAYLAPSAVAFDWFWNKGVQQSHPAMTQLEVWHEGRCCRCGRVLTVPSSIAAGIGPECAGKM